MLHTTWARRGMVVAPHALAAQAGLDVLREGGNAIEAAIATAASLAVVYPHMTGIGGDAFWMVYRPGHAPTVIDAAGRTAGSADAALYREQGLQSIPHRGPLAANTVAGAVSAWEAAYGLSERECHGRLPLRRLLEDAIAHAEGGFAVTGSQAALTAAKFDELALQPDFAAQFLPGRRAPREGEMMRLPQLADTLWQLGEYGAGEFYRGELAEAIAADLAEAGAPLALEDLRLHRAELKAPLVLRHSAGTVYNTGAPTQGIASLILLALHDRWRGARPEVDSADYVHLLVEATKQAFAARDRALPAAQDAHLQALLEEAALAELGTHLDPARARPWDAAGNPGDTTWFGAVDGEGRAVSAIQSLYHEYGSALVLRRSGICWQNRGCGFSLRTGHAHEYGPDRKPFHTLNPALALLCDGRVMSYGAMGGDGQPQTQAAVFTRYACHGQGLQQAVSAPRWLLGRTWGAGSSTLKLEARFPEAVFAELERRGHTVERVAAYDQMMGHAGALVRHPNRMVAGACDPRSDGGIAGY